MAADMKVLQGEVNEAPGEHSLDVEGMLASFLRALLEEQKGAGNGE